MARFRGKYNYTVDPKGRLNIPAKFRKALNPEAEETFVICRAPDGCLWAYPQDEWEKFEDRLEAMPLTKDANRFQRIIQDSLTDSKLDKQGRITLTAEQMKVAGITKNISLIGRRRFVEIWDREKFENYTENTDNFDDVFYKSVQEGIRLQ